MTDKQIEAAARKLCELHGNDPDRIEEWLGDAPMWRRIAKHIEEHLKLRAAIEHGLAQPE